MIRNLIPVYVGIFMLSGCNTVVQDIPEKTKPAPFTKRVVEKDKSVTVTPAAQMTKIPAQETPETIILQDGVDAFFGYQRIDIPESLSGSYPTLNKGIIAVILAFNLRSLANEEGVSAWAKIRTSAAGETIWQFELTYLPDDAVYATDYKVYFEKIEAGFRIARIGHRVKCYRGPQPKHWTVELCP